MCVCALAVCVRPLDASSSVLSHQGKEEESQD